MTPDTPPTCRRLYALVVGYLFLLGLAAGCQSGRGLSVFGYSTESAFDPDIRTVYVPVFKNFAFLTTPHRGIEADVTAAVVREINTRTPMRVVSDPAGADTELLGTVVRLDKGVLNRTQQNHVREAELSLTVTLVWRDLRTGRILSNRGRGTAGPEVIPFDPSVPAPHPPAVAELPNPVSITATGRLLHELGETNASAQKMAVDNLARQIVNMMERPW